jgi:anti-sigma B factor antagonist
LLVGSFLLVSFGRLKDFEQGQNKMDISSEINGKFLIIKINEETIDMGNSIEFREGLAKESEINSDYIILDLSKINYLDSSGIGGIITFFHYVKDNNKELKLANCSSKLKGTIKSSGIGKVIPIFDTIENAME